MCLGHSEDVFQAGPVNQDQQGAVCLVVCPQPMQRGPPSAPPPPKSALLEGGLAKDWVWHQAGDAIVLKSNSELRPHISWPGDSLYSWSEATAPSSISVPVLESEKLHITSLKQSPAGAEWERQQQLHAQGDPPALTAQHQAGDETVK